MPAKLISALKYIVFLGLGLFIAWWSLKDLSADEWNHMWDSVQHSRMWLLIPIFLLLLMSHWVRALRWKILMKPLGYHPSSVNTFLCVLTGYFINMFLPRAGEIARCSVLSRYEKTETDKLIGTIIVERAFDFLCLIIVILITFFTQGDIIAGYISDELSKAVNTKAENIRQVGMVVIAIMLGFFILLVFLLVQFSHLNFIRRFRNILRGIWTGLISVKNLQNKKTFFLQTFLIWLLYYLSTWLGTKAFYETESLGLGSSLAILVLGSFGMIATPNGIGAYPEIVKRAVNVYGISRPMDIAFGLVMWGAQTFLIIIAGIASFILLPMLNRHNKASHKETIS